MGELQQITTGRIRRLAWSAEAVTRRDFLKMGLGTLALVAAIEGGGATLLFLRGNTAAGQEGSLVNLGPGENFPPGSVTEFADRRFFLVRTGDGGFMALYRRCPHLGCTVSWQAADGQFICPCHASVFDLNGNAEGPPVPRALDAFAVKIEGGDVIVDTTQRIMRQEFDPSQLVYI